MLSFIIQLSLFSSISNRCDSFIHLSVLLSPPPAPESWGRSICQRVPAGSALSHACSVLLSSPRLFCCHEECRNMLTAWAWKWPIGWHLVLVLCTAAKKSAAKKPKEKQKKMQQKTSALPHHMSCACNTICSHILYVQWQQLCHCTWIIIGSNVAKCINCEGLLCYTIS